MAGMSIQRLIDANLNRAAEGIRLLEDLARFVTEDSACAAACKAARHDLQVAAQVIWPDFARAWHRDTAGDVGTQLSVPTEADRSNLRDLAVAAGSRSTQALRALEEVAKLASAQTYADLEAIRYRMYDIAATIERQLAATVACQWPVCLLLTVDSCLRPWNEVLEAALHAGVSCIQVREKMMSDQELVEHVRVVCQQATAFNATVIVNDRVDIALAAGAHGAHLGQDDLSVEAARRCCGHQLMLGVSTHCVTEAVSAVHAGASYIGVGPIYASTTKPTLTPAGHDLVTQVLPCVGQTPHLAIGGVTPETIPPLRARGVHGVAVGAAICGAADPHEVAKACVEAIQTPCEDLVQRD